MSDRRARYDRMRARLDPPLPPLTEQEYAALRRITHLRIGENRTLCETVEPNSNVLGEWLDDDPREVGCQRCRLFLRVLELTPQTVVEKVRGKG